VISWFQKFALHRYAEEPLHKMTAMHFAARKGHVQSIMALANLGASVNVPDAALNVPLGLAVENLHKAGFTHSLNAPGFNPLA
jgi:ankyrin repeat protein